MGNLGTKVPDNGELTMDHPEIEKLSDPIHFVKNYKYVLWKLIDLATGKSETCEADALRLSRNMAYMLAQHAPDSDGKETVTFEEFLKAAKVSFEHHWNNREFCGAWCQAKSWTEEEKVA